MPNSTFSFIKTTLKGGILFFLPLVFLYIVIEKIILVFKKIIVPFAESSGFMGLAGKTLITVIFILLLLLICFTGGLLMRTKPFAALNHSIDTMLIKFVPSYKKMKKEAAGKLDYQKNTVEPTEKNDSRKEL